MQTHDLLLNERDPEYRSFIHGKSCVLVGPAPQILNDHQGRFIDENFDLVIRFNKALHTYKSENAIHIGTRCDILYHCKVQNWDCGGPYDKAVFDKFNLKWIAAPHTGGGGVNAEAGNKQWSVDNGFKFHHFDLNFYDPFSYLIRSRPNVACGALVDLLRYGASEVYVTGVTMMKGGYDRNYKDMDEKKAIEENKRFKSHDLHSQLKMFQFLWGMDKRFKPDKHLKEIMLNEPRDSSTY